MHNIQEEKDYSKPINSLKDKLMQLKKDVSTVSKAHAKTEKAVQKTVDDKDQALTPEDHQAAMGHFRGLYQNAKRNKDDSGANEAARQYHDYANKLSDIYQRKLKEETMNPYLQEDMQLDENLAVHGKYTIKTGPAMYGMGEGSPDHVTAHKGRLKAIGIKADASEQDGRYGTTHRVTVKNNETGESTGHHVYQSGTHGTKPTMTVRTVGAARKNQEEHHGALKDYLSGKKPTTKYSGLASESANQPVAGSLKPGRTLHPGWMLAADPKLRAAVNAAKAKQKEFKRLVGTKTNEEYDLTEETIDTSKDRQGKIKVGSKVRSYDFPGYHNDHYIEGHVHQETPHSYHIQVSKVVRAGKEMPIPAHMHHVEAPKGKGHFSNHYAVHPLKEGFVAEVSDALLTRYLIKLDRDNLKHKMDPTKRSDAKTMKSGANFVRVYTKLDNRKQGVAEEVELEEASAAARFNQKVKQAQDAHQAGDHKRAKYHLDVARNFMLGINSNDHIKIKDSYPKYKELRDTIKEEVDKEHQKILDRARTSTPKKPKGEYERKVSSYLRNKYQKEEVELDEAVKLGTKVKIHAPGKYYHGQVGHVGEIRHGLFKSAPKTYTVDYGDRKSIQLDKKEIRVHKEEVEHLDELSNKTLQSYTNKSDRDMEKHWDSNPKKYFQRSRGQGTAILKLGKRGQAFKPEETNVTESYEKAEKHKDKATKALETSDMEAFHHHMSNHHEEMGQWHESKGRHSAADREYSKAELHHEKSLKPSYNDTIKSTNEAVSHLSELSTDLLARYKKKASAQASELDKEGFASTTPRARSKIALDKAHQRFKGINKATIKQFDNDAKR